MKRTKTDLSSLEPTIEALHELAGADSTPQPLQALAEESARLLEYFSEKNENNRLYHKKQSIKNKIARQMIQKLLGADELKALDQEASKELGDGLTLGGTEFGDE
jgi:hypothetical protein